MMDDLRQIEPFDLYHEPAAMAEALDTAQRMAKTTALLQSWPEMHASIDVLIERQEVVVRWWDDHVGNRHGGDRRSSMRGGAYLKDAESLIGIGQPQISRWKTSLADKESYRARLISRVMRAVNPPDPSARRSTPDRDGPDFWPTPQSLITACMDHVLPLLPAGPIWECAAGDGRLVRAIATRRKVFDSDLYPQDDTAPIDFLSAEPPGRGCIVLTNPPYNASDKFIGRGLGLLDDGLIAGLVLLLRHDHLQAGSRVDVFNQATIEVHCNWRPIWIDGTEGQPRWSFHWIAWLNTMRRAPLYLREE